MKAFKNLFGNIVKLGSAKMQDAADTIDKEHSVDFAKQDIEKMEEDLLKANDNIGEIKGQIAVGEDKIKMIKAKIKKHDEDAKKLKELGDKKSMDLAIQHCDQAELLESQLVPLEEALKQQKQLLEEQTSSRNELKHNVDMAKAQLVTLKAMEDAASANEKMASISISSGKSALAKFKEREEAMKARLVKSRAIKEESSSDSSLDAATEKALGESGGSSRLTRL